MEKQKLEIYDTSLRDGTQAKYITVSMEDKINLTKELDQFGVDYIEGGWPGSNPKDAAFFEKAASLNLSHAKLTAFGSTARDVAKIKIDDNLHMLLKSETPIICIFGKTWKLHSEQALGITDEENETLIFESVKYLKEAGREVFFDAEHFFDGFKNDEEFALRMIMAVQQAGASRIILCDTNGGSLPTEIYNITKTVSQKIKIPLGIHTHNDSELAVANSLAALEAGVIQFQGTINGFGERCGNANLCSLMPILTLKNNYDLGLINNNIKNLTHLSHVFYELTNQVPNPRDAFVGKNAFTHKGGIHVSSVLKNSQMYEHMDPKLVGNQRDVVISELSGKSNIRYIAQKFNMDLGDDLVFSENFVKRIKSLENEGFQFDGAEASLKLMLLAELKQYKPYFKITYAKVNDMFDEGCIKYSESVMKIRVENEVEHTAADGNGPVNALDKAMRKALSRFYPEIATVHLSDYKVRVLDGHDGTNAKVRVLIECSDLDDSWSTVGVSNDIIEASLDALTDSMNYKIYKDKNKNN